MHKKYFHAKAALKCYCEITETCHKTLLSRHTCTLVAFAGKWTLKYGRLLFYNMKRLRSSDRIWPTASLTDCRVLHALTVETDDTHVHAHSTACLVMEQQEGKILRIHAMLVTSSKPNLNHLLTKYTFMNGLFQKGRFAHAAQCEWKCNKWSCCCINLQEN